MSALALPPLADAEARHRLLTELDRTFFVEAGAGTGKTTMLVGRVVNLVAAGRVAMEALAAITFTEAAAAELRDRVREGLERAAADPERPAVERERCRVAAGEIDLAAISTIHAFAGALLRTYPLEAGLPPGFATLDEIEQGVLFEERFKAWFWGTALEEPARGVLRRALLLGLTQDRLRELAATLEGQHDLLAADTAWPAPAAGDPLTLAHDLGRRLLDLEPWTVHALDGADDPLVQTVARAQIGARRLALAPTEGDALAALRDLGKLNAANGQQARWGKLPDGRNACKAIKDTLKDVNAAVADALDAHRGATFAAVLALLRDFVLEGVRQRKADGVATFQDLLAWARDLLRDHPGVRRRAQARFRRLFVDEFQDTDPLQAEIAFYLTADERPGEPLPADWREIPLAPGKLFIVGDPKQSIYRFRRADIAVYDALLQRLEDAQERLVQNFRAVRPVLDWVNHHFPAHMLAAAGLQPPYVPLAPSREGLGAGTEGGVFRVGAALEGSAADAAREEASALAALARTAVDGGWLVADRGADGAAVLRPAQFRDVCVLLPTRTHLRRLERALEEAGVPYRVEAGKLVLATQEVRDLLACLRAIEDPSDQVALVAALRSPAYGCSDVDILRWVEGGGRLDHERPGDGPDGPVKDALASLAGFHATRHRLSPPALIDAFIRDRLLVAAAFGDRRPREAWRRLRYVVSRARAFTATGRHTLRAFLDWVEGLQRAEVRDPESGSAESDEDALHIQTIHGAKGLEYPIVLLGGLGTAQRGRPSTVELIPDRFTGELACSGGAGWRTVGFDAAKEREQAMADAEAVRLLYVGATRARDHLVLSLFRGRRAEMSPAARIEAGLAEYAGASQLIALDALSPLPLRADETRSILASGSAGADGEVAWFAHRQDLLRQLTAASIVDIASSPEGEQGDVAPASPPSRAATIRTLVRRGWRSGDVLAQESDDAEAVESARAILASAAVGRARESARCRHDVDLLGQVDGVVLDVRADLVYETTDGLVVATYVRDHVLGRGTQDGRQHAALLALAFRAATGHWPVEVEWVNGVPSWTTERARDVMALADEARATLTDLVGSRP